MAGKNELPTLHIPRQGMHWGMKVLLGAAGLVVVQLIVVTAVLVGRQTPAQPPLAVVSPAPAAAPAVAAAVPAAEAPAPAQPAEATLANTAPVAVAPSGSPAKVATKAAASGRTGPRTAQKSRRGSDKKLLAAVHGRSGRGSAVGVSSADKNDSKNDAIDDLLKKFK